MRSARLLAELIIATNDLPNDRMTELIEIAKVFRGDNGPAWKAFIRRTRESGLPEVPPALISINDKIALSPQHSNDPKGFFLSWPGVMTEYAFRKSILDYAKSETLGLQYIRSYDMGKRLSDYEIQAQLGEGHCFDHSELCARIEQLIRKQPNGEAGHLNTENFGNLFYLNGEFVIRVMWLSSARKWNVNVRKCDDMRWEIGCRIFSHV